MVIRTRYPWMNAATGQVFVAIAAAAVLGAALLSYLGYE